MSSQSGQEGGNRTVSRQAGPPLRVPAREGESDSLVAMGIVERLPPVGVDLTGFVPAELASSLSGGDETRLRTRFRIPAEIDLLVPRESDRPHLPPIGWVCLFEEQLRAGVRFPLPSFLIDVLNHYRMPMAQLVPNAIRILVRFLLICLERQVTPSVELFRYFYQMRKGSHIAGYRFLQARTSFKINTPENNQKWKSKFFFVRNRDLGLIEEWNYRIRLDHFPNHSNFHSESRDILESAPWPENLVITEEELAQYGLCSAPVPVPVKTKKKKRSKVLSRVAADPPVVQPSAPVVIKKPKGKKKKGTKNQPPQHPDVTTSSEPMGPLPSMRQVEDVIADLTTDPTERGSASHMPEKEATEGPAKSIDMEAPTSPVDSLRSTDVGNDPWDLLVQSPRKRRAGEVELMADQRPWKRSSTSLPRLMEGLSTQIHQYVQAQVESLQQEKVALEQEKAALEMRVQEAERLAKEQQRNHELAVAALLEKHAEQIAEVGKQNADEVADLKTKVQTLEERVKEMEEKAVAAPYATVVRKVMQTRGFSSWLTAVCGSAKSYARSRMLDEVMAAYPQLLLKRSEFKWDPYYELRMDVHQQKEQKTMPPLPFLEHLEKARTIWTAEEVEQLMVDYDSFMDDHLVSPAETWVCEHDGMSIVQFAEDSEESGADEEPTKSGSENSSASKAKEQPDSPPLVD